MPKARAKNELLFNTASEAQVRLRSVLITQQLSVTAETELPIIWRDSKMSLHNRFHENVKDTTKKTFPS